MREESVADSVGCEMALRISLLPEKSHTWAVVFGGQGPGFMAQGLEVPGKAFSFRVWM